MGSQTFNSVFSMYTATLIVFFFSLEELFWPHCDHQGELLKWLSILMHTSNPFLILVM